MSVFGLPFFVAGVFMFLVTLGAVPVSNADEMPGWGWPALVLMGAAFTAVGGTLVFGRSWTTIDTTQRAVIKQWGLVVPLKGFTAYKESRACAVAVARHLHVDIEDGSTDHEVRLSCSPPG